MSPGRRAAGLAAAALCLTALLGGCSRRGPEELPDRPMSLRIEGLLASQIIEMAAAVGGFRVEFTEDALRRAERAPVTLDLESVPWNEVLEQVVEEAGLAWDWVERGEGEPEWVIRVRLPDEE